MFSRARSLWLACVAVAYVCFAALQAGGRSLAPIAALVLLPLALVEIWRRTAEPRHAGQDRVDPVARRALRAGAWGGALWVAARTGPPGRAAFDAVANLGTGAAAVSGLLALTRLPSLGGMLSAPRSARSLDAAVFAAFLWSIALALPATRAILPNRVVRLDPLAIDYATTTASSGGLLLLVAATLRLRWLRRLEIGVADRVAGALALSVTALLIAVPAALFDVAAPDRVLPAALIAASLLCTWTATTPEPTTVASALRGVLAVMILGAPTVLSAGLLARSAPKQAGAIVLVASCLSIAIGLIARAVAKPLGPEQSRWLEAIDAASRGALQPEPDAAIRAALFALSQAAPSGGARPELWRAYPEQVLSVDIAGYLHTDEGSAPAALYELARDEPERTLRADVLRALEVRRPEVRPLLSWFEARRAFALTLVVDEEGSLGFLLLPQGNRALPMTLEEARAVRILADRLSALLAVSSALARSRQRELEAVARADELDDERKRLEHIIVQEGGRHLATVERSALALRRAAYSPAARLTLDHVEKLGRMNANFALRLPVGCAALGWAAVAHLASPRHHGPLIVIDAASGYEHDLARWTDDHHSPLRLADGGTLLILDAPALPAEIQDHIARALSRFTGHQRSSILPTGLVVTTREPLAELQDNGRFAAGFARWFGQVEVVIPSLSERAEDLRPLTLDWLARLGLAQQSAPFGLEPAALRSVMEHGWPGNEVELEAVLTRAAALASGRTITEADLAQAGFVCSAPLPAAPEVARPRPRPRRTSSRAR